MVQANLESGITSKIYNSIELGEERIDFIIFPDSSNTEIMKVTIQKEEGMVVHVPKGMDIKEIYEQLENKSSWILGKLQNLAEIIDKPPAKELVSGEKFPYLGRRYFLEVVPKPAYSTQEYSDEITPNEDKSIKFSFYQGKFWLYIHSANKAILRKLEDQNTKQFEKCRDQVIEWYREKAVSKLVERVQYYAKMLHIKYKEVRIKDFKRRWGTCTPKNNLDFNWRIILAPQHILDYVVIHELIHVIYPNHSHKYWNKVKSVIPDMEERREWLRINGPALDLF